METLVISPTNGLCNKLRVVFSYLQLARMKEMNLTVLWNDINDRAKSLGGACPGFFLDCFEPVRGVDFVGTNQGYEDSDMHYKGCHSHPKYDPQDLQIFTELKPLPHILEQVQRNIQILGGKYIAVHIRRTDHVRNVAIPDGFYSDDKLFTDFIDSKIDEYDLYLATDNRDTQDTFFSRYPGKIKAMEWITPDPGAKRQTTLEDSIVDLYTCIGSCHFFGTRFSSFSEFIESNRRWAENIDGSELIAEQIDVG